MLLGVPCLEDLAPPPFFRSPDPGRGGAELFLNSSEDSVLEGSAVLEDPVLKSTDPFPVAAAAFLSSADPFLDPFRFFRLIIPIPPFLGFNAFLFVFSQ